jgi:hypothetical protein
MHARLFHALIGLSLLPGLSATARAVVPRTIALHGVLNNAADVHLPDGPYSGTLRLYDT